MKKSEINSFFTQNIYSRPTSLYKRPLITGNHVKKELKLLSIIITISFFFPKIKDLTLYL